MFFEGERDCRTGKRNHDFERACIWDWTDSKGLLRGSLMFVHNERQRRRMSQVGVHCISGCERGLHTFHNATLAGENILILHVPIHVHN